MIRRVVWIVLVVCAVVGCMVIGCGRGPSKNYAKNPFTLEYKIDKSNAAFFTEGDTVKTMQMGGPFYAGAHPLPGQDTGDYEAARAKTVKSIIGEADKLVDVTRKLKLQVASLRDAYLDYLTVCLGQDKKLTATAKTAVGEIVSLKCRSEIARAQYESIVTKTDNDCARSLMEYMKVVKAVETAGLCLEDVNNIVGLGAVTLGAMEGSRNAKIKAASAKLDKAMSGFDSMREDLQALVTGMRKVSFGFRQLETADYYFARASVDYMLKMAPDLEAKMKAAKPREGLSADNIDYIRSFVAYTTDFNKALAKRLDKADKSGFVKVSLQPDTLLPCAWAMDDEQVGASFGRAVAALESPDRDDADFSFSGAMAKGWDIAKKVGKGVQYTAGTAVDLAGATTRSVFRTGLGVYYGNSASEIADDIKASFKEVKESFDKGTSGSGTLRVAKAYMEDTENGAQDMAESGVAAIMGDGYTSWIAGHVAKATVGLYTGLAKGVYAVADPTSTTGELAEGALEIGFAAMGGSKTIFRASNATSVAKGVGEGATTLGKKSLNYIEQALVTAEKSQAENVQRTILKYGYDGIQHVATQKGLEIAAKEATLKALQETSKALTKRIADLIKQGAFAAGANARNTIEKSLNDFAKQQFQNNMKGFLQGIRKVLGDSAAECMDNIVSQIADDYIKELVRKKLDAPNYNGLYVGKLEGDASGTIKITIMGASASGSVSGSSAGDPFSGKVSGRFDPASGSLQCAVAGSISGKGEGFLWRADYHGKVTGQVGSESASGKWSASADDTTIGGGWSAVKSGN